MIIRNKTIVEVGLFHVPEYSMKLNRIRTVIISLSEILIQPKLYFLNSALLWAN